MTLEVDLPEEIARRLAERAAQSGAEPSELVVRAVERTLTEADRLDHTLGPVRQTFEASGMSEDALSDLLENEKHANRRGE